MRATIAVTITLALLALHGVEARQPRSVSLVVTGGTVVTMDAARRVLVDGAVAVDADRIVAVGPAAEIAAAYRGREVIDATGQVILPGLINTHTHAPMVLYRGLADDLALMDWLQQYIFPAEAKTVSPAFVRTGTRLAVLELIQSGTTAYADMYYFQEEVAAVTKAAGLRGVLGQTIIQFPVADAKTPVEGLARAAAYIARFKNDSLIVPAVATHALYTNDPKTLIAGRDLAIRERVPLLIHLAETEDEVKVAKERGATSPTAYLDGLGFFTGATTLAAHGVWVSPDDIATLARRGVGVSHNPESNMKLASGTAPVTGYLAAGVALGLGTDGAASNNDLDMFEAMRQASFLAKLATRDPRAVGAQTALEMATLGGARALGMADRLGSLEAGKLADLITVRMGAARQTPMYDPVSHLVYTTRGDDVDTTIVGGRVLMRARHVLTLDAPAVLAEARAAAEQVRAAVRK